MNFSIKLTFERLGRWLSGNTRQDDNLPPGRNSQFNAPARELQTYTAFTASNSSFSHTTAEESLRKSEERYRITFENIPIGAYQTTSDGRILMANPALLEMLGYESFDELAARNLEQEGYENQNYSRQSFKQMLEKSGELKGFESAWIRKDGKTIYVRENARITDEQNGIYIYEGTAEDITEKKEMEIALLASERRFKALIQNSSDVVLLLDKTGKTTYASPSVTRVLGYSPEEIIGHHRFDWIHPDDLGDAMKILTDLLISDGKTLTKELRTRHKSGCWIWIEASALNLLNDPSVNAIVINYRDITARKHAQRRLEETLKELERSNKELEQFAYIASHDLQEPLRMVTGYLKLLLQSFKGKLEPKAEEYIGFAVDGANRMINLIKDLLTLSKVTTRANPFAPVDLNLIVGEVIKDLHFAIEENKASVIYDKLPVIKADEVQMRQLFQNLISNALKFRSDLKPEISIRAEKRKNEWLISLKDNGLGIDPSACERIFIIFQRVHERDKYPGTGIGLAVCRKIVERHGGRIWVESEEGKGATFYFTLPQE